MSLRRALDKVHAPSKRRREFPWCFQGYRVVARGAQYCLPGLPGLWLINVYALSSDFIKIYALPRHHIYIRLLIVHKHV